MFNSVAYIWKYQEIIVFFFLSFFLSLLVSLILEHYTRECEFGNFDKINNKNNTKNKHKINTIAFG